MNMFAPRTSGAAKIMMNTLISGSVGGLISSFLKPLIMGTYSPAKRYDVGALTNGILAGLVSITGACDRTHPWSACLIGVIGAVFYSLACKLTNKLGVDDPIEATQVHAACGIWGIIAVGVFDNEYGLISDSGDSFKFLGVQLLGVVVLMAWTALSTMPFFFILKCANLLRVPLIHEVIGMDVAETGTNVYIDTLVA